jgi:hypothetical protein
MLESYRACQHMNMIEGAHVFMLSSFNFFEEVACK